MQTTDRQWARTTLGVTEGASQDDIERAYLELQAVWEPHKLSGDEWMKQRAEKELEKIERARTLLGEDAGEAVAQPVKGMPTWLWAVLIITAFAFGFFGMRVISRLRAPNPVVVTGQATAGEAAPVTLTPPSVSVSSSREGEPPLTPKEQETIQDAIAGLAEGWNALEARDALEKLGEKAIPAVTQALSSPDPNVRMNAAMILNTIAAGTDNDPNTDEDRRRLLPFFQRAGTVPALSHLARDPNSETRQNVAYGLGNIGDPTGFDTVVFMAKDPDIDVRAGAAYSLGKLNDVRAIPTLIALLNDPEIAVRETAVEALRAYDTPEVKSALSDRLPQETDPEIIDRIKSVLEGRPSQEADGGPTEP